MRYWLRYRRKGDTNWVDLSFSTREERDVMADKFRDMGFEVET